MPDRILRILALDTSGQHCSVALLQGGEILSREVLAGQRHSELVLPMIKQVLEEVDLRLTQLDGIAFGAGPGSFTGLRIACGVTQGLALGAGLPVIGICTLEALAQEVGGTRVIAALDARMNEIYHAAYEQSPSGWQVASEPALCQPQDAPDVSGPGWRGCGSGFDLYAEVLSARYDGQIDDIVSGVRPRARAIVQLAVAAFEKGLVTDPEHAAPLYIRSKVALKENER